MKIASFILVSSLSLSSIALRADDAKPAAAPANNAPAAAAPAAGAAKPADAGGVKRAGKTFTGEAKKIEDYLTGLFDQSRKTNAPGAEGKTARDAIGNALDWDRVAKDCLGPSQYKATSEKNRSEFRNLLRQVIEKTAYSRLAAFWKGGTTYVFKTIDVKGGDAHVTSEFNLGGDVATLDYYLEHKGSDWKIYDIAYENLRYSKNINEQLEAFLREKGFPNLLTQLRKRLDELNDAAKPEKG